MRDNPRKPTLATIAREAGVSIATASYVLSNKAGVTISNATRSRVEECAERLGYRRNAFAAALRSGSFREVGILSPSTPQGTSAELVFALAEAAVGRGLALVLHIGQPEGFNPSRFESVVSLGPLSQAGVIGTPHVEIGTGRYDCQIHVDHFGGSRRAVEHLLSFGHRRVAHFAGPQSELAAQERLRGFLDAVHEGGLRMEATPVIHSLAELTDQLNSQNRPTAILAQDDEGAAAIYRAARTVGLKIPEELSVIGFGDESFASKLQPPLTTSRVEPEVVANAALDLLDRQLGRLAFPTHTLIPTSLVIRESTAHPG